jgi:hypothetical protein
MSVTPADIASPPRPRVRHQARDAVTVMAFSATASCVVAGCLLLLTALGHQG